MIGININIRTMYLFVDYFVVVVFVVIDAVVVVFVE